MTDAPDVAETDIAIIGMAGRFPGARDVDELWRRIERGEDCLVDLEVEELRRRGVTERLLAESEYVRRTGVIEDVDSFDREFFDIGSLDAAVMDPQHRHFLECSWQALESAGIVPDRFDGSIGVFAGCGMNTYLVNNLMSDPGLFERMGWFLIRHTSNDKDFLATTVSYRLDLRGPSVNVQTACSTSLVAIHLAAQSLISMECDAALAGGVTIEVPHGIGYVFRDGEVLSPDGHCRAFDAESNGTVLTSGAGVVVLRRLSDAIEAGDDVLAVIKGSAANNDGRRKVSYLAPSVDGHADVVAEALAVAGLTGDDLQLLEAHGTGTAIGDPIEFTALTQAFRSSSTGVGTCRLVSTKPNIGHLDTAAGVASVIKVVQALRHETLPPLANHTGPSPLLDLDRSPFTLSGESSVWPGDRPRRAGVSSLGVGGTNAHVVVEEAPPRAPLPPSAPEQVLAVSARHTESLDRNARALADLLDGDEGIDLGDVAHTLATRRRPFERRRIVTATDAAMAARLLRDGDRTRTLDAVAPDEPPGIAFVFPGGGAQYRGMAAGLDDRFDTFHDVMADGRRRIRQLGGVDLEAAVFDGASDDDAITPMVSLPSVFLTSVALARQWMAWGVQPRALLGHSLGEYVAAHIAGVLDFEDALGLVVVRAQLIQRVSGGDSAMLVVSLPEDEAAAVADEEVVVSVVNADDECVLSGPGERLRALQASLTERDVESTFLPLATAGHSPLLDPILDEFRAAVAAVTTRAPSLPYVSNVTGTWITAEQATSPDAWVRHLRHTVRFADGARALLDGGDLITVELGPGHALSSYVRRVGRPPVAAIPALRHPRQDIDDTAFTIHAFARQWAAGADVDLDHLTGSPRQAVTLPPYQFRRDRHWIDAKAGPRVGSELASLATDGAATHPHEVRVERITDPADMFFAPVWQAAPERSGRPRWKRWWVVGPPTDPATVVLLDALSATGVTVGLADVDDLAHRLADGDAVAVLAAGDADSADGPIELAARPELGAATAIARTLGGAATRGHRMAVVTSGALAIDGPAARPLAALGLGPVLVAPREYPDLDTILVDAEPGGATFDSVLVARELTEREGLAIVAVRGGQVMTPVVEATTVTGTEPSPIVRGGTYVVTGGLGAIGHLLGLHLAEAYGCNLVVVAGSPLPDVADRAAWCRSHGPLDATSQRIRRLQRLHSTGAKVEVVVADLAVPGAVAVVLDEAERRVGKVDGAFHTAGALGDELIELISDEGVAHVLGAKVVGARELAAELERRDATLLALVSSTSTFLAPPGQVAYVAANAVLDVMAGRHGSLRVVTIGSGVWNGDGMAADAARRARLGLGTGERVAHPVFEERHRDGAGDSVVGHLDTGWHWMLDDHRSSTGEAVLPGTGHLELLIGGVQLLRPTSGPISLTGVAVQSPLVVDDGEDLTVRVRLAERSGVLAVTLESAGPDGWRTHSEGEVALDASALTSLPPVADGEAGGEEVAFDPFGSQRAHVAFGRHWDVTASGVVGDGSATARLSAAVDDDASAGPWLADPAVVDAATGLAVVAATGPGGSDDLFVPVTYEVVTWWRAVPQEVVVDVAVREPRSARAVIVDVEVRTPDGLPAIDLRGLQLLRTAPGAALHRDHDDVDGAATAVEGLAALSGGLGIDPSDTPELVDRLLHDGRDHLFVSSVDLLALARAERVANRPESAHEADHPLTEGLSTLARVRGIWEELLGIDGIEPHDDFFDLGGHSIVAIRLMARLKRDLGAHLQLSDIFDASTLADLTELVAARMPAPESADDDTGAATTTGPGTAAAADGFTSLVKVATGGDRRPLFVVHGAGGNVLFLWGLAKALSAERSVYAFQARGIDRRLPPDMSIGEMANRYVGELLAAHEGPFVLGGYSGGGIIALEMVKLLQAAGHDVLDVLLFDSVPPGCAEPAKRDRRRNLVANARRHGVASIGPFLAEHYAWRFRRGGTAPHHAEELADWESEDTVDMFPYFSWIAERHTMTSYDVDATVFKADRVWPIQPDDYYWSPYVTGRLDFRNVPGDHRSMFFPENIPALAAAVEPVLRRTDEAVPYVPAVGGSGAAAAG